VAEPDTPLRVSTPWGRSETGPDRRHLLGIVLGVLGASAVSWIRAASAGTLQLPEAPRTWWEQVWPALCLGGCLAVVAFHYLALVRRTRLSLPAILAGGVVVHLLAGLALPLTSNDLFVNLAYGRLAALGLNPYVTPPAALPPTDPFVLQGTRWQHQVTVYGPVFLALVKPIGRFSSAVAAVVVYKASMLAAALLSLLVAYRVCRERGDPACAAGALAMFALAPVFAWELSGQAHIDAVVVLLMVGFVWAAISDREWLAAACLATALFTKLSVAPVLALYLVAIARRRALRAAAMTVAVVAAGLLLFLPFWEGPASLLGFAQAIGGAGMGTARSFSSLALWLVRPLGPTVQTVTARACWVAGMGVVAAVGVRALVAVRTPADVIEQSLLVLGAYCLVGTPWFHPWYVTWLLPLALVHRDARWRALTALYAAIVTVQYILPLDPLTSVAVDLIVLMRAWTLMRGGGRATGGWAPAPRPS
jgi:hypothetical protein